MTLKTVCVENFCDAKEKFDKVAICTFSKTSVMLNSFYKPVPHRSWPAVSELKTCFRYTLKILLAHLVWGQLLHSNQYVLIGPTFILVCLVLINIVSYAQRSVGMRYGCGSLSCFFFSSKKGVSVELVHRSKSCCVSSVMQVSPFKHRFWKPSFQKSWQNGLSEALERFQYLFIWNKDIKSSWE